MPDLRVAVDATALLGDRTGIGVFATELLDGLAVRPDVEVTGYALTWRGRGRLAAALPDGVRAVTRPLPARPLRLAWRHVDLPPIEPVVGAIDLVHGTNYVVPPTRRAAAVVSIHDLTPWRFPELCTPDTLAYPALVARAVARGAWVHTDSQAVADEVVDRLGVPPERVRAVWLGPSPGTGGGDAERGRALAGAPRYVLALGTVEPRKGLPTLVEAFDLIAVDHPDLVLVLAGPDGWGAAALDAALASARHADRVRRPGWVPDGDRRDLLAGAAAFAYPSRYEGFGLPVLEAMDAGVPVVASTAGSIPEVAGDAALLVPPDEPQALAAALAAVLDGTEVTERLVTAGKQRTGHFGWERTVAGLVHLYRDAAAARG